MRGKQKNKDEKRTPKKVYVFTKNISNKELSLMPSLIKYYTMIKNNKRPELIRRQVAIYAREHGNKPASREFGVTVKTVRKWMKRYDGSIHSLKDHSKAPKHIPHKTSKYWEKKIVNLRKEMPTWGAERLKRDFEIPCSGKAIHRIFKQHGLVRKRRKKHHKKNDLREIKRKWALFQQIDVDTKHLYDIAAYWPQMTNLRLPKYQYTARDVVSGLQFVSYAGECSITYSILFIERILTHLKDCGVDTSKITIQSDNGSEFIGSWQQKGQKLFCQKSRNFSSPPSYYSPGSVHLSE